jgi:hypothetical protein
MTELYTDLYLHAGHVQWGVVRVPLLFHINVCLTIFVQERDDVQMTVPGVTTQKNTQ